MSKSLHQKQGGPHDANPEHSAGEASEAEAACMSCTGLLAVSNVLNAHVSVRDGTGGTPQVYQPAFLDPYGRSVSLSFRRLF